MLRSNLWIRNLNRSTPKGRIRYIKKQVLDRIRIRFGSLAQRIVGKGFTVRGGQLQKVKCLFLRSRKAGGRDGGECSDADEGFLMTGGK